MNLRLKQLRLERGLTLAEAGKIIFVNQALYLRYENQQLYLPLEAAILLAQFYRVSLDYLYGITDPFKTVYSE